MYPIPGHVAMSLLGAYSARVPYGPAIAATLIVDVVDKVFRDILDIAPYGRCWMHTLLAVIIFTGIITYWKGREWGISWFLGHFLHLIGDIGFIPWFYPFLSYSWPDAPNVIMASAQGLQETLHAITPVQDATGTITTNGFHFSQAVSRVFKEELIILESLILFPITAAILWPTEKALVWKRFFIGVAILATLARLTYDFPPVILSISSVLGDWVLVD